MQIYIYLHILMNNKRYIYKYICIYNTYSIRRLNNINKTNHTTTADFIYDFVCLFVCLFVNFFCTDTAMLYTLRFWFRTNFSSQLLVASENPMSTAVIDNIRMHTYTKRTIPYTHRNKKIIFQTHFYSTTLLYVTVDHHPNSR